MTKRSCTRREFATGLAAAAAAPLVVASGKAAQPTEQPRQEAFESVADALTAIVRLRHGKHLSADQLKRVRQRIESQQRGAALLRRPALRNSDEPDFVFGAALL
ncbi:MAG: hypothetical protein IT429_10320 [Gemmataceae bacterium]|nr:hypothetical protein [Gemmataceae bacterium]